MLDWWIDLPSWLKYGVALLLMISTIMWLSGYFWPWGWGVGGVLLLAAMAID